MGTPRSRFRLEHRGFQRRLAPALAGPAALSDGDAAGGVRRSLRGNLEPPPAAGAAFLPPRSLSRAALR